MLNKTYQIWIFVGFVGFHCIANISLFIIEIGGEHPMIKDRQDEILWDTVTILRDQNRFENALVLFKTLIERTFSTLKLPTKVLEEVKMDIPSNDFVKLIRIKDKEIYQFLNNSDTTRAYESFLEYIEKLSEITPEADRKKILANILAEQTQRHVESIIPIFDSAMAIPVKLEHAEAYTSTEAAEIIGVTDQTIRRWCEKGKYPDAIKTHGGHWRIPKKYFKITLEEALKRKSFEQELNSFNGQFAKGNEDEFF